MRTSIAYPPAAHKQEWPRKRASLAAKKSLKTKPSAGLIDIRGGSHLPAGGRRTDGAHPATLFTFLSSLFLAAGFFFFTLSRGFASRFSFWWGCVHLFFSSERVPRYLSPPPPLSLSVTCWGSLFCVVLNFLNIHELAVSQYSVLRSSVWWISETYYEYAIA